MNTLSNIDIINKLKEYGIIINEVTSKDLLPNKLLNGWYIINLQNHNKGHGTHWTCFYYSLGEVSLYFDSFGFNCPEHLHLKLNPYIYNHKEIQDLDSSACGWFCIALIKYMNPNINVKMFRRFCNSFSNKTFLNDRILNKFL